MISEQILVLERVIDTEDFAVLRGLLEADPVLFHAPVGYGGNGPLTRVAECRGGAPSAARLAMATWLLEAGRDHGVDVHQGGDAPLMRAALADERLPMMELLVAHGADVNARYGGFFPILAAPCETLAPRSLAFLLAQGAEPGNTLDVLLGTYLRAPELATCIELLLAAGATTTGCPPVVLTLLRRRWADFAAALDADPSLVHRRFPDLTIGATAYRRLDLRGATLLHVAAEFGHLEAAELLWARGAEVDAPAELDPVGSDGAGLGGQSPLFHAASQFGNAGLALTQWLLEHGANPHFRAHLPGHYEDPNDTVEATPAEYAARFPGPQNPALALLRSRS